MEGVSTDELGMFLMLRFRFCAIILSVPISLYTAGVFLSLRHHPLSFLYLLLYLSISIGVKRCYCFEMNRRIKYNPILTFRHPFTNCLDSSELTVGGAGFKFMTLQSLECVLLLFQIELNVIIVLENFALKCFR